MDKEKAEKLRNNASYFPSEQKIGLIRQLIFRDRFEADIL